MGRASDHATTSQWVHHYQLTNHVQSMLAKDISVICSRRKNITSTSNGCKKNRFEVIQRNYCVGKNIIFRRRCIFIPYHKLECWSTPLRNATLQSGNNSSYIHVNSIIETIKTINIKTGRFYKRVLLKNKYFCGAQCHNTNSHIIN